MRKVCEVFRGARENLNEELISGVVGIVMKVVVGVALRVGK